jgi:prephenate dehydrogenase
VTRVAVAGLGLIGGSLALAVRARGYDRDPSVRDAARRRGIEVADSLSEAVAGAQVAVASVSTEAAMPVLVEIARAAPAAVLTDTASLKRPIVEAAPGLPAGARFVGGHPMAGSQKSGVEAASADLFRGRPWILCRTARSDDASLAAVTELVRAAGGRPVLLDAERHDQLMTWASHLPLAVASALARSAGTRAGPELASVAGPGLLDSTRVAGQPASLALELALADPAALADAIDDVRSGLADLATALRDGDVEAVRAFFEAAAERRREMAPGLKAPGSP